MIAFLLYTIRLLHYSATMAAFGGSADAPPAEPLSQAIHDALTAPAVDVESGTITLKKHKTRHKGKTRILYLCKEAIEILADQRAKYAGEGFLFRGLRGKPLSLQAMTMRFQRISEKVGRTVTSYMYRHTWATRALSAGIPDTQVAAMLGHSSTAMIHKHYSHVSENARLLKGVAEKVAG